MESFWHEEASCWMHVFEAKGWKLIIQECGKRSASILLEGRGNGSEGLGELHYSNGGVEKFIEFMERFENASQ